jgi:Transcriptional regulator, AbiEi antitoxin/Protein of unknown function (DUF559)
MYGHQSRELSETVSPSRFVTPRGRWRAAAEVARRQYGVISLSQLIEIGFTRAGVVSLGRQGRLHRIHRGVYALSPAALSGEGNLLAAVLACGAGALLASRSAAGHYGLIANRSSLVDVATEQRVRRPGIRARRIDLEPQDRAIHRGIPCTSVARTMLDLAAVRPDEVAAALEQAEQLGLFDLRAIDDVIVRNEGRRGVRRLRSSLSDLTAGGPAFRSEFERRFLAVVRSADMPEPLVNHVIGLPDGPIEVDFHWPDLRLVVEVDGYRFHGDRRGFRNDRRRDRRLASVGIRTLRYVWEDLTDPGAIRRELNRIAGRSPEDVLRNP